MQSSQNTIDLFHPAPRPNKSRQANDKNTNSNTNFNSNRNTQNNTLQQYHNDKKDGQLTGLNKYRSQPKFRTLKQQILRIPKVKQILNKDKYVFSQDIQKRIQLIGSLKADKYQPQQLANLHQMRKAKPITIMSSSQNIKKKIKNNKRHKTNFKIPLTRQNINSMNNLLKGHIDANQKYKNQQVIFLKEYQQNAPFSLEKLRFMDDLNPIKRKYKEKFPDYKEGVLSRNKLLLQHVILNRNIKRQIKLDQKKQEKMHVKRVFQNPS